MIRCQAARQQLVSQRLRLSAAIHAQLSEARTQLATLAGGLQMASPLATLERGYALVTEADSGRIVKDATRLKSGQTVETRLARGSFVAAVTEIKKPKD